MNLEKTRFTLAEITDRKETLTLSWRTVCHDRDLLKVSFGNGTHEWYMRMQNNEPPFLCLGCNFDVLKAEEMVEQRTPREDYRLIFCEILREYINVKAVSREDAKIKGRQILADMIRNGDVRIDADAFQVNECCEGSHEHPTNI